jgi:hypothetical protein
MFHGHSATHHTRVDVEAAAAKMPWRRAELTAVLEEMDAIERERAARKEAKW